MFRLGLNRLNHAGRKDDWIWIVDHSIQIGKQKCLLVLGIQQSKLPPEGTPLRLKDMKVLGLIPSEKCNRESVGVVYRQIAKKYGIPRAVLSDGAVELRGPVNRLKTKGKAAISIRDLKHFLANRLEHLFIKGPAVPRVPSRIGKNANVDSANRTVASDPSCHATEIQIYEFGTPIGMGQHDALAVQESRFGKPQGNTKQRMQEKLAWLEEYEADIVKWTGYQTIISTALTFINKQGLKQGYFARTTEHTQTIGNQIYEGSHQSNHQVHSTL